MNKAMIEKVARAIFAQSFHPYDAETGVVDEKWGEWEQDRERAQSQAKAALSAILEDYAIVPRQATPGMCRAFFDNAMKTSVSEDGGWHGYAQKQLTAMISAAERTSQ